MIMKLKLYIINQVAGILSGMKINRIGDKAVKASLLKDYLALHKIAKGGAEEKMEIRKKFQADWDDEIDDVESQRMTNPDKPVEGHDAFLDAEQDALVEIHKIDERDEDVELAKVRADALYDADLWADDILLGQIQGSIEFLTDVGVAE